MRRRYTVFDKNARKKGAAMLEVRKARADEIDAVLDFYAKMIDGMQGTDFDVQWRHDGHPSKDFLREAVADGQMIVGVLEGEGIASAMVVNHEGEPGYEAVPWSVDAPPENVGVLHVVATLPAYHGRGFARQLLQGGMEIARADGLSVLRLDTFPYNVRGRGLYESCGFADKGEWTVYYPALGDIQVIVYELPL